MEIASALSSPVSHKSLLSECSYSLLPLAGGAGQALQLCSSQGVTLPSQSLLTRPPKSYHTCYGKLPSAQAFHLYTKVVCG